LEEPLEVLGAEATRVARVPDVLLLLELATGDVDLAGVHDDDRITDVEVVGERGLVLPTQGGRDARGQAAERGAVGVDDPPAPLDVARLDRVCRHLSPHSSSSASCSLRLLASPYSTRIRHSPWAGALGPACARSAATSASAKRASVIVPRPTQR